MSTGDPLRRGEQVPDFTVVRVDGRPFSYGDIWQRRDLALIVLPPSEGDRPAGNHFLERLTPALGELSERDSECVVTFDSVSGLAAPGALVADRWGEIYFVHTPASVDALPTPAELIDWLRFVQIQCAECQGETR